MDSSFRVKKGTGSDARPASVKKPEKEEVLLVKSEPSYAKDEIQQFESDTSSEEGSTKNEPLLHAKAGKAVAKVEEGSDEDQKQETKDGVPVAKIEKIEPEVVKQEPLTAVRYKPFKIEPRKASRKPLTEWCDVLAADPDTTDVEAMEESEIEGILRLFDLNPKYGPFSGIARDMRWKRAQLTGKNPPLLVKRILDCFMERENTDIGSGILKKSSNWAVGLV